MSEDKRKLRLGAFLFGVGHHMGAWRHPDVNPEDYTKPDYYVKLAQLAERGKMDAVFFADNVGLTPGPADMVSKSLQPYIFDPLLKLATIIGATTHIGLVSTVSTSYLPPFHLARKFATLDHLSGGRAGWNLVTSGSDHEAQHFGKSKQTDHSTRYRQAREYVDVVKKFWDVWEDDAFRYDQAGSQVFEPSKIHRFEHRGEFYQIVGGVPTPRPPQGYPVFVQAGSSEDGQALAAETAEVVFTAQQSLEGAQAFYRGLKAKTEAAGRSRDALLIMPGVMPVVGKTRAEAQAKLQQLQDLTDPALGLGMLAAFLGAPIHTLDLDGPVPDFPPTEGWQSRQQLFVETARRENLTVRQLVQRIAGARGHWIVAGTPEEIADQLQLWFENEAADGFNVLAPVFPAGLEDFVDHVIPVLQERGLFRTEYESKTFRGLLGLERPENQYVVAQTREEHANVPIQVGG